jgi:SAM-dependent methyltransferase
MMHASSFAQVLDVGSGTGLVALEAAQLVGPQGRVVGVDLSSAMLHKARVPAMLCVFPALRSVRLGAAGLAAAGASQRLSARRRIAPRTAQAEAKARAASLRNLELVAADIDELCYAPGTWDAILCSSAVPFLPDIPAALRTWREWLRPGGRVVFNCPKVRCVSVYLFVCVRVYLRVRVYLCVCVCLCVVRACVRARVRACVSTSQHSSPRCNKQHRVGVLLAAC